ncbi:hypothetical protein [Streptomyces phytophilus]|uniref:hypothetical protein n=1 Tax=Streptomyces phytophilus TaxID=722715 RepID=UPI002867BBCB|nr:hypothetical protein [Streptomyces phytophilus]
MSFLRFFHDDVMAMARTLESSGDRMKESSKKIAHTDASLVGHDELRSACDDFADSWDYGFGQLSKLTKGVSKFVVTAADELEKLDKKLHDELQKAGKK